MYMRKLLLFFLSFWIGFPMFSQTIISYASRVDNETSIVVKTDILATSIWSNLPAGVSLTHVKMKETGEEGIFITLYFQTYSCTFCQEGSRAVFKTFSGSTVTIEQILSSDRLSNRVGIPDRIKPTYALFPLYSISKEDLMKLMKEGIQKIRIETLVGFLDFTYKKDELGGYLAAEYASLFIGFDSNF